MLSALTFGIGVMACGLTFATFATFGGTYIRAAPMAFGPSLFNLKSLHLHLLVHIQPTSIFLAVLHAISAEYSLTTTAIRSQ